MFLVLSCRCLCPIHWSQVLSQKWRCSWSSSNRQCSNYIWVINDFIAYQGASYIRGLQYMIYISWDIMLWWEISEMPKYHKNILNPRQNNWQFAGSTSTSFYISLKIDWVINCPHYGLVLNWWQAINQFIEAHICHKASMSHAMVRNCHRNESQACKGTNAKTIDIHCISMCHNNNLNTTVHNQLTGINTKEMNNNSISWSPEPYNKSISHSPGYTPIKILRMKGPIHRVYEVIIQMLQKKKKKKEKKKSVSIGN